MQYNTIQYNTDDRMYWSYNNGVSAKISMVKCKGIIDYQLRGIV